MTNMNEFGLEGSVVDRETCLIALVAWIELYTGMAKNAQSNMEEYLSENLYVAPAHMKGLQAELREVQSELNALVNSYMGVLVQDMRLL